MVATENKWTSLYLFCTVKCANMKINKHRQRKQKGVGENQYSGSSDDDDASWRLN